MMLASCRVKYTHFRAGPIADELRPDHYHHRFSARLHTKFIASTQQNAGVDIEAMPIDALPLYYRRWSATDDWRRLMLSLRFYF